MTIPWRPMRPADLAEVARIAALVHRDFPEEDAIFAERLALCPEGCLMLAEGAAPLGYAISHPWHFARPPALDMLLGTLPDRPESWYLHDIALRPEARGSGAAARMLARLEALAGAAGLDSLSLVAVGGTEGFWARQGFVTEHRPGLAEKLASYGPTARFMARRVARDSPVPPV